MVLRRASTNNVGFRDVSFVLGWVLTVVLLVPVQLASILVFDSTGFDALVPDVVFLVVVPAFSLASVLVLLARRFYARQIVWLVAVVAFVTFALVGTYTRQFYAMCGAGC